MDNGSYLKYIAHLMTIEEDVLPEINNQFLPIFTLDEDYGPALPLLLLTLAG